MSTHNIFLWTTTFFFCGEIREQYYVDTPSYMEVCKCIKVFLFSSAMLHMTDDKWAIVFIYVHFKKIVQNIV